MLTLRAFTLTLIGTTLLVLSAALPILSAVAAVYLIGLAVLIGLDRQQAGRSSQFTLRRQHDSKLSLGVANPITIRVTSRRDRPTTLTIRDEPPLLFFGAERAVVSGEVAGRESADFSYGVRPLKRGDFTFGDLNLRWQGPLRLWARQAVISAAAPVKVYPNLQAIRQFELLARRDQLAEIGVRNVRRRGEGTAFESLRDYTPDDPYRSINWKATARRGKPISTDYEPERSQRVLIALDIGRMMRSPIRVDEPDGAVWNMAKVDFVINSVLLFAYVATLRGDQVGLLVFADRVEQFIPPAAGRAHFQTLLEAMYKLTSQPVEADYARALAYLRTSQKQRALVVLFTDLSGARAADSLLAHLPRLVPRHVPLLVTIRDPALEAEAHQPIHDSAAVYRRAVAEQLIDERRLLLEKLHQRGVLTLDVNAQTLTMAVVNRYLELKQRAVL